MTTRVTSHGIVAALFAIALSLCGTSAALAQSSAASLKVLREAAAKGNVAAQYALGAAAEKEGDMASAVAWYQTAALAGYAGAQYNLARLLEGGQGVPPDWMAAEAWYQTAAAAGFPPAVQRIKRLGAARASQRAAAAASSTPPAATTPSAPGPSGTSPRPGTDTPGSTSTGGLDWSRYGFVIAAAAVGLFALWALRANAERSRQRM